MSSPANVGPGRAVYLVARREINARVRTRAFVLGTVGMLLAVLGYAALMTYFADDEPAVVGLAPQHAALAEPLAAMVGEEIETREVAGPGAAEQQVRDGGLDLWVTGPPAAPRVLVAGELDDELRTALDGLAARRVLDAQLSRAGLDPRSAQQAVAGARAQVINLEPVDPQRGQRLVLSLAALALLYFALVIYGSYVAQGVVEEKSSRVVELLLSTVRPWQLLAGKLIGIGVFGLLQLSLLTGAILVAARVAGVLAVPALGPVAWTLCWFVLGYFLFASLLAATGALVSRQEEVQSAVSPVMTALVVPFVLGVVLLTDDPESPLVTVLSLLPPFAPILMPARIALDVAPLWQVGVAGALTVVVIVATTGLAGRIYSNAVLRTGARVKLRDALHP